MEFGFLSIEEAQALLEELRRLKDSADAMLVETRERIRFLEEVLRRAGHGSD